MMATYTEGNLFDRLSESLAVPKCNSSSIESAAITVTADSDIEKQSAPPSGVAVPNVQGFLERLKNFKIKNCHANLPAESTSETPLTPTESTSETPEEIPSSVTNKTPESNSHETQSVSQEFRSPEETPHAESSVLSGGSENSEVTKPESQNSETPPAHEKIPNSELKIEIPKTADFPSTILQANKKSSPPKPNSVPSPQKRYSRPGRPKKAHRGKQIFSPKSDSFNPAVFSSTELENMLVENSPCIRETFSEKPNSCPPSSVSDEDSFLPVVAFRKVEEAVGALFLENEKPSPTIHKEIVDTKDGIVKLRLKINNQKVTQVKIKKKRGRPRLHDDSPRQSTSGTASSLSSLEEQPDGGVRAEDLFGDATDEDIVRGRSAAENSGRKRKSSEIGNLLAKTNKCLASSDTHMDKDVPIFPSRATISTTTCNEEKEKKPSKRDMEEEGLLNRLHALCGYEIGEPTSVPSLLLKSTLLISTCERKIARQRDKCRVLLVRQKALYKTFAERMLTNRILQLGMKQQRLLHQKKNASNVVASLGRSRGIQKVPLNF